MPTFWADRFGLRGRSALQMSNNIVFEYSAVLSCCCDRAQRHLEQNYCSYPGMIFRMYDNQIRVQTLNVTC